MEVKDGRLVVDDPTPEPAPMSVPSVGAGRCGVCSAVARLAPIDETPAPSASMPAVLLVEQATSMRPRARGATFLRMKTPLQSFSSRKQEIATYGLYFGPNNSQMVGPLAAALPSVRYQGKIPGPITQ